MDASEMRELLQGYLSELDWSGCVTKDQLIPKLDGRDDALRPMVGEYVPEETFRCAQDVLSVIPTQAWKDVQSDRYQRADTFDVPGTPSNLREDAASQD